MIQYNLEQDKTQKLFDRVQERKELFLSEYDDEECFKDLRWQEVLESFIFGEFFNLSKDLSFVDAGECVALFYDAFEKGEFDLEKE